MAILRSPPCFLKQVVNLDAGLLFEGHLSSWTEKVPGCIRRGRHATGSIRSWNLNHGACDELDFSVCQLSPSLSEMWLSLGYC